MRRSLGIKNGNEKITVVCRDSYREKRQISYPFRRQFDVLFDKVHFKTEPNLSVLVEVRHERVSQRIKRL